MILKRKVSEDPFFASQSNVPKRIPGPKPTPGKSLRDQVREFEAEVIRKTLSETAGNVQMAADILGLPRPTLMNRMRMLDVVARDYYLK